MPNDNVDLSREYIRTSEASKRSNLSMPYLTQLLRDRALDGFQLGREWFIYLDSLEMFLKTPRKSGPKGPRKKRTSRPSSNSGQTSLAISSEEEAAHFGIGSTGIESNIPSSQMSELASLNDEEEE